MLRSPCPVDVYRNVGVESYAAGWPGSSRFFLLQCRPYALGRQRERSDSYAGGAIECVRKTSTARIHCALAAAFCPIRSHTIPILDELKIGIPSDVRKARHAVIE